MLQEVADIREFGKSKENAMENNVRNSIVQVESEHYQKQHTIHWCININAFQVEKKN